MILVPLINTVVYQITRFFIKFTAFNAKLALFFLRRCLQIHFSEAVDFQEINYSKRGITPLV